MTEPIQCVTEMKAAHAALLPIFLLELACGNGASTGDVTSCTHAAVGFNLLVPKNLHQKFTAHKKSFGAIWVIGALFASF